MSEERVGEVATVGFVGPLEEADQDRCPLCGGDPQDPTMHAGTCPTVTENLCGVIQVDRMCILADHIPTNRGDREAWDRWYGEHEWLPLDQITWPPTQSCASESGGGSNV